MDTPKSSEPFSIFEDPLEAIIEPLEVQSALLPPQMDTPKSSKSFSVFENSLEAIIESSKDKSVLLPHHIATPKSSEVFSIFEDQPEEIKLLPESENTLLQSQIVSNKSKEAFTVYEEKSEEMNEHSIVNASTAEKTILLSQIGRIESPEAFSVYKDEPALLVAPLQDENSMMLPEMPTIESHVAFSVFVDEPEAVIENENSMIAFSIPEDVTETHHSIRELLIKKKNVPIYEDNQESESIAISLPSVAKVGFSIFEDSVKVVEPKSARLPLICENEETSSLHMSRKENVFIKPVPIQGAMESFQIFEDKTETVPTMAFRNIKLIEELQKKRSPSEDFFDIMMKSPCRPTNSINKSILKPELPRNDNLDHENEGGKPVKSSVLSEEKSPSTFDVDEENLNTEKFQFNLNSNTNSTLIHSNDINDLPPASEVGIYDDLDLSIALNENEAALLKFHQPAFKIPEIPVKRAEKKKEEIIVAMEHDDEEDDLSKSIYVTKQQPDTYEYEEEEWLETDENESSFVVAPNNQYEHTIIVPEASNKVRVLIEADAGNPFNPQTREAMLEQCNFSSYLEEHIKTCTLLKKIPPLKVGNQLFCGNEEFTVLKAIGKGSFGAIFSGKCKRTGKMYAMKQEKPANLWEYYVIVELMSRLVNQNVVPGLMRIDYAVVANNASVLISEFSQYGSLIDVCNKVKAATNKNMDEYVAMLLTTQILTIIDHLHGCRIIHADIKPDNFILINKIEYGSKVPAVQLIDFGCAIDMDWYQENETFNYVVETENFTCIEMMEKKPWTYQTDLYGLAGTTHVMLFGKYMEVQKRLLSWSIKQRIPRYFNKHLWDQFFHSLLNIPGCDLQPNLQALKTSFEEELEFKERYIHDKIQDFNSALCS